MSKNLYQSLEGKKILFANFSADGHFNPLTGLAVYLKGLGCDVRWYCSASYAQKIKALNIEHYTFQKAKDITGANIDTIFPERKAYKNAVKKLNFDLRELFVLRGPEYYTDIREIYEIFPFDLMIADCAFLGIPFVHDLMDKPVISIGVLPLTESSKDVPPTGLGLTPANTVIGKLKQQVLRFLAREILFKKSNLLLQSLLKQHGIKNCDYSVFDIPIKKSSFLLQIGTPSFEYKRRDMGSNVRFIGALLPWSGARSQQAWYSSRLKSFKHIVVLTQGTVEKDVTKLLMPALEALKDTDILVVCTTGGSQTKELRHAFPQANIIIEDFIPFDSIMPHASAYITNGGYGGVMLGIQHGLPMVVAGVHEGKNEICARVGYFNLGINLKTEAPSAAQILKAVRNVINDPAFKKNVEQMKEELKKYDAMELVATYAAECLTAVAGE